MHVKPIWAQHQNRYGFDNLEVKVRNLPKKIVCFWIRSVSKVFIILRICYPRNTGKKIFGSGPAVVIECDYVCVPSIQGLTQTCVTGFGASVLFTKTVFYTYFSKIRQLHNL